MTSVPNKPLFIPIIKQFHTKEPALDVHKLCIRNPHFFKINFQGFSSIPHSLRVIKRNLKYLRATKHCRFKSSVSLYKWRLSIQAEEYGIKTPIPSFKKQQITDDARKNPTQFLRKLTRNGLSSRYLSLELALFSDFMKQKCNLRELKHIKMLRVANLHSNFSGSNQRIRKNLLLFTNLKSLFLDIELPRWTSKLYFSIFKTLNRLSSGLESLRIKINFARENSTIPDLNKFDKLKHLHLQLSFDTEDPGLFFSKLECFPALESLNLEILSPLEHSEAIKFVSQHKNLQSLKFQVQHLDSEEYNDLLQNLQKIKSLKSLSILERESHYYAYSFACDYKIFLQTLEALENLKSLKLSLSSESFRIQEIKAGFNILFNHPSLGKIDISVMMDRVRQKAEGIDEEFYQNATKLIRKLRSFKLSLVLAKNPRSDFVFGDIANIILPNFRKIITPKGKSNRLFACEKENRQI